MHELIDGLFLKVLGNKISREKRDSAILKIGGRRIAFTTDSYVVKPIFFPGGDIGSMAVYGTVNDLSVCGARPLFIAVGMIIEEGLDRRVLEKITVSIGKAAKAAAVTVVTGDIKVVEKGACDKIFINTSGIGEVYYGALATDNIKTGDAILISGPVGEHAISVLSAREGIDFGTNVKSDSAPLHGLILKVTSASKRIKFMRDPTRGGLATTLNEIVKEMPFGISIDEDKVPVSAGTRSACELLGFDPLYLACEGQAIFIVDKSDEEKALKAMRSHKRGRQAMTIGRVVGDHKGKVYLNTIAGGKRLLGMLSGEQLPRIC